MKNRRVKSLLLSIILIITTISPASFAKNNNYNLQELMDRYYELGQSVEYSTDRCRETRLDFNSTEKQYTTCSDFTNDFYHYMGIDIPVSTYHLNKVEDTIFSANMEEWAELVDKGTWRETIIPLLQTGDIIVIRRADNTGHAMLYYGDGIIVHSIGHSASHGSIHKQDLQLEYERSFSKKDEKQVVSFKILRPLDWNKDEEIIEPAVEELKKEEVFEETVINETSVTEPIDEEETITIEETTVEETTTLEESSEPLETISETTILIEETLPVIEETSTAVEETLPIIEESSEIIVETTTIEETIVETAVEIVIPTTTIEETLPIETTTVEETTVVEETITEESIIVELVNKNISVKGVLPKNTELSVIPINNRKKSVSNVYKYDITLINDGKEIQPEDTITLIFSFDKLDPNLTPHVYHTHDDKTDELKYQIDGNNIIVEVDSFSIFTVEFTYEDKEYVLQGEEYIKLTDLLDYLGLTGEVEYWEISNNELFTILTGDENGISYDVEYIDEIEKYIPIDNPDGNILYMVSLKMFDTEEWLDVTINGITHHIIVTDDAYVNGQNQDKITDSRVVQGGNETNFTATMPLATIFIDEDIVNMNAYKLLPPTFYTQADFDAYKAEHNGEEPSWNVGDVDYDNPENTGKMVARLLYDSTASGARKGMKVNTSADDGNAYGQLYFDFSEGSLDKGTTANNHVINTWAGPVVEYRFINAAERFNVETQQYERMDVIITYSNINISMQYNFDMNNYDKLTKYDILDANKIQPKLFATSDLGGSANDRTGLKLDVNIKVVDKNNELIPGSYYFPLVDADIGRNGQFGNLYQGTTNENNYYSEQFVLLDNYGQPTSTGAWEQKIWIPGGDYNKNKVPSQINNMPYLSKIDSIDGNLRIKPGASYSSIPNGGYVHPVLGTTLRDEDFYTGFATLANNTEGGVKFRYWGTSAYRAAPTGSGTVTSYVLAGTQRINHKLDSSSDVGGTIYTTTTGNADGSLSGGELMGNSLINTPHQISTATGQNVTYTMTPKGGYRIKNVYIKSGNIDVLEEVENNNGDIYNIPISELTDKGKGVYTYTFTNIQTDNSIHVEWEKTNLTVTKNVEPADTTETHRFNFQIRLWETSTEDSIWRVRARKYNGVIINDTEIEDGTPYYMTYYEYHNEEGEIETYTAVPISEITDETNPTENGWYELVTYEVGLSNQPGRYITMTRYFLTEDAEPYVEIDDTTGLITSRKTYYTKDVIEGNIRRYYQHILGYNEETNTWTSYDVRSDVDNSNISDLGLTDIDIILSDNYRFVEKDGKVYLKSSFDAESQTYTKYLLWVHDDEVDGDILVVGNEESYPTGSVFETTGVTNKYVYIWEDGVEGWSDKIIRSRYNVSVNGQSHSPNTPGNKYKYEKDINNPVHYDFTTNPDNLDIQSGYSKLTGETGMYIISLPAGQSPDLSAFEGTGWDLFVSKVGIVADDFDMDAAFIEKGAIPIEGVNTYTFSLAPGETIDFEGCVPMGWTYTIKEIGLEETLWTLKTHSRNASMANFDGDEDVTFVNKPPKELVITKKWVEPENQNIARPEEIVFTFKTYNQYIFDLEYYHSSKEAIKVEKIDDTWTYTFLVRYDEALESITENSYFGYNTTYDVSTGTITNTYAPTSIEVIKTTESGQDGTFDFVIQLDYVDAGPGYLLTHNDTEVEIMGSTNYLLVPEHVFINGYNAIILDEPYERNGYKFDKVIIGDELQRLLEYIIEHCYFDTIDDTNYYYWPTDDITLYTDYERPYLEEYFILGTVFSIYGEQGNRILDAWAMNLSTSKGHIDYWEYMDFSEYGLEYIGDGKYKFSITTENGEGRYKFEDMLLPGTWNRRYSIWEIVPDGWKLVYSENTNSTIEYKDNKVVRFTNEKISSLTIRKEADVDTGEEFEFKVNIQGEFYTFKLKSGEELTISDIPYGYEYEIYELDEDGNEVSVGDIFNTKWKLKSVTNQSGTLTENTTSVFTNEIKKGSINIKKETVGNVNGEFKFKLKAMIDNIETIHSTSFQLNPEYDYWVDYVYNGVRYAIIHKSKFPGDPVNPIIDGNILLIIGNEEDEWSGNVLDYIVRLNDIDYINETTIAEIIRNNLSRFAICLNNEVIPFSELNISNMDEYVDIVFEYITYYISFDYSIKMEPTRPYDLSSQLGELNSDGYYEFTLENSELLKLENIPYTIKYEIYEEVSNGWRLVSIDELATRDKVQGIVEQEEITHTFLNEPLYSLIISKEVTGNIGDKSKDFEVVVKIQNMDLSEYGGIYDSETESYIFTISHGEKIIISNIPYGYSYTVTEKDYSNEGYTQYINNEVRNGITGTIEEDIIVEIINDLTIAVPTKAYDNPSYSFFIILPIVVFFAIKRKKHVRIRG